MDVLGIHLVGVSGDAGRKLLATILLVAALLALRWIVTGIAHVVFRGHDRQSVDPEVEHQDDRRRFWARQAVRILVAVLFVFGVASIWFDDPGRLATVAGLLTAGVAIALQRVITSFAGYLIILRGRTFTVGDRITMGGVRGDVVALDFMQTTVMEMGQPPAMQSADPPSWVNARQYTGRIVRVTNDRIFDSAVYNYTREFPYVWEEMHFPIKYTDDRALVERILLDVARRHTGPIVEEATPGLRRLERRYPISLGQDLQPHVYLHMTDNWLEFSLRFIAEARAVRPLKDAMTRDVLVAFEDAKIGLASGTYEIVGLPPMRVEVVQ
jgi:small-conductance mechanosensitive channel